MLIAIVPQAWFYGQGLELPVKMEYDLTLAEQAYALAERWNSSRDMLDPSRLDFKASDLKEFDSNQISTYFLTIFFTCN
jgi:leukotriene-A4 hydrolase